VASGDRIVHDLEARLDNDEKMVHDVEARLDEDEKRLGEDEKSLEELARAARLGREAEAQHIDRESLEFV
jgi:hypothetical protein